MKRQRRTAIAAWTIAFTGGAAACAAVALRSVGRVEQSA